VKIFLSGGSGFIGRNLVESHLSAKYEFLAPSHSELDLLDSGAVASWLDKNKVDYVIHSAYKPGHRNAKDPAGLFYANTRMFFNIASDPSRFRKMLVMGSGGSYDSRHYQPKMKEDYFGTHIPVDEHGFTRYVCGKYIEKTPNITDLRIFGLFGKYEDYAIRFISNMICKAIFDLPLTIKQNRKFDYLWVGDLPRIVEHFLERETPLRAYNVTPDKSVELVDLARAVLKVAGKDLPITVAVPGLAAEYSGDNSLLRKEIKDLALTPVGQAIESLYSWYSSNKGSLDKSLLVSDK
jgi:UDP-glucose 4-epimerase